MRQYLITGLAAAILLSSCGSSSKDKNAAVNDKKVELEKLKGDKEKLDGQIKQLETDIRAFDPALEIGAEALLDRSWASSYYDHLERLSRGGAAERIIGIENICQSESVRD